MNHAFVFAQTSALVAALSRACERHLVRLHVWPGSGAPCKTLFIECRGVDDDPGLKLLATLHQHREATSAIVIATCGSEALAVAALRLGARDYIRADELDSRISAVIAALRHEPAGGADPARGPADEEFFVGHSPAMRLVMDYVERCAPTPSNVLITGETGTGKEIIARAIHRGSARADRPFVCVNCAALPETLAESELFGYERGAFTGAATSRAGRIRQAHEGTLFLDEIGDMSLLTQAKVLRAIEAREVSPLGSERSVRVDVRIIAATHQDLEQRVAQREFRQDLFFRLNVVRLRLPPLRERRDDIPQLVDAFVPGFNRLFGLSVLGFTAEALDCFRNYSWPGNVRELRNVLEVVFLRRPAPVVTVDDLPAELRGGGSEAPARDGSERATMLSALLSCEWNVSAAARRLHWSRMTMYRKIAKYQLNRCQPAEPVP
jgi:DNA-binding NtrC family response regulator